MAGGSAKPSNFYTGAVVYQQPAAMDVFVRSSPAGAEFVYAEAPQPPRSEPCWVYAGELVQRGLVRTHERRRQGGGRQYYLVRTTKALPRELDLQEKALSQRATRIIFDQLKREANLGAPCSSDAALMRLAGLNMRQQTSQHVRKLIDAGLIRSELQYEGGVPARVVTILASKHAGAAAGKFTALPKKWAELRRAAERDAASATAGAGR